MNDNTPKKNDKNINRNNGFSPVTLSQSPGASSQKNLTGLPRIAKDIVADLYNNIQYWNDGHIKGAQLVKQIAVLKSEEPKHYSLELEKQTIDLYKVVQDLIILKNNFENFKSHIKALGKLKPTREPLFISLEPIAIANLVEVVADAYIKEYKIKIMTLENIAHSRNKSEAMFFAACWTLQPYITSIVNLKLETLLVETGHRNFN